MPVMRVQKNSNYTVMANHHLRDDQLSLKAKGLLSVMLSLPADWDYTLAGLAHISKEGIDAIRSAVNELVHAGYIIRSRRRNEAGQLSDTEYIIYEFPQDKESDKAIVTASSEPLPAFSPNSPSQEKPMLENPTLDNPTLDLPTQEKPVLGKPTQSSKDLIINDLSNPYQSSTHLSVPDIGQQFPALVQRIKEQIDYWDLIERNDKDEIEDILAIMVEVMSAQCSHFTISGKKYPAALVRLRYSQINAGIVEYVLECLHKCSSNIRNIKQYLITTLFNAPATCESYYGAAVRRDLEFMRQ